VSDGPIVANSSPLIALAQIDLLELTRLLFGMVFTPRAVRLETVTSIGTPSWMLSAL
jgi:predicted nucleic acid-binding protein